MLPASPFPLSNRICGCSILVIHIGLFAESMFMLLGKPWVWTKMNWFSGEPPDQGLIWITSRSPWFRSIYERLYQFKINSTSTKCYQMSISKIHAEPWNCFACTCSVTNSVLACSVFWSKVHCDDCPNWTGNRVFAWLCL